MCICLVCINVQLTSTANGIPGGDLVSSQDPGEEVVTKKKKKKKKKKKPTESDTGTDLPSTIDASETKDNGDEMPGLLNCVVCTCNVNIKRFSQIASRRLDEQLLTTVVHVQCASKLQ